MFENRPRNDQNLFAGCGGQGVEGRDLKAYI